MVMLKCNCSLTNIFLIYKVSIVGNMHAHHALSAKNPVVSLEDA